LAVALAECCLMDPDHPIGAAVQFRNPQSAIRIRVDALLFGESAGRIIVTCEPAQQQALRALAGKRQIPWTVLGRVEGRRLILQPWIDVSIEEISDAWRNGLEHALGVEQPKVHASPQAFLNDLKRRIGSHG
jgi:phosphoribosylformylglycinamidine synthase